MNRAVSGLLAFLLVAGVTAVAQDSPGGDPPAGGGLMAKLRDDLKKGVENGHLTDTQKETLKSAGVTLREAAQAKQNDETVDRKAVKKAFSDIKKIVDSDAFQPEDQAAIKTDIQAIKDKARESRGGRRGLFRR